MIEEELQQLLRTHGQGISDISCHQGNYIWLVMLLTAADRVDLEWLVMISGLFSHLPVGLEWLTDLPSVMCFVVLPRPELALVSYGAGHRHKTGRLSSLERESSHGASKDTYWRCSGFLGPSGPQQTAGK